MNDIVDVLGKKMENLDIVVDISVVDQNFKIGNIKNVEDKDFMEVKVDNFVNENIVVERVCRDFQVI